MLSDIRLPIEGGKGLKGWNGGFWKKYGKATFKPEDTNLEFNFDEFSGYGNIEWWKTIFQRA